MRSLTRLFTLFCICAIGFVSSCDQEEPEVVCTTNTKTTSANGSQSCGISKIQGFSTSGNQETLRVQVAGGYEVILYSATPFQEGTSYQADVTSTNLSRHISNSITFVKIDRTAKKITLKFRFENEMSAGVNGTVVVVADGQATDLIY